MGFLDKLFSGNIDKGDVSKQIDNEVVRYENRIEESDRELRIRESLGQDIDAWCITESREVGIPFDCFFEWELDAMKRCMKPQHSANTTFEQVISLWSYLCSYDKEVDELKPFNNKKARVIALEMGQRADNGDLYASAVLGSDYMSRRYPDYPEVQALLDEVVGERKTNYRSIIETAFANNNTKAMVAYALFVIGNATEEAKNKSKEILYRAGQLGSSEAYYRLYFDIPNHHSSDEGFKVALAAAECDDGPDAYWFQEKIGDAYYYGDGWDCVSEDKPKGVEWYRRAASNGYASAITTLQMLERNGEI